MGDQIVARVNGKPITLSELQRPLIEAFGLRMLMYEVQLNIAKQKADEEHLKITDADFAAEQDRTLKAAFEGVPKEDYPALLDQLLQKNGVSRVEFDMQMQTNAIVRKIAEPMVRRQMKDKIDDAKLMEAFNALYGETVVVKHIQCANPQEAMQVKTRLAADEKFETLVHSMSRNARTAALDGELPPFSRQTDTWGAGWGKVPQGFKDFAFRPDAKPGDISDPIQADGGYHILKLERKLQPKVVKFEDAKENIRQTIQDRALEEGIRELRGKLLQIAIATLKIEDPILSKQYEARRAEQAKAVEAQERARQDVMNRAKPTTNPTATTLPVVPEATPSGTPAGATTGQASPAKAPAGERPPAPKSAAPQPGAPDTKNLNK